MPANEAMLLIPSMIELKMSRTLRAISTMMSIKPCAAASAATMKASGRLATANLIVSSAISLKRT